MNFKLTFQPEEIPTKIVLGDRIFLLGSCFSNEMESHFRQNGFETVGNPFGTLFHPLAIANILNSILDESEYVDVYQRDDLFFSWDCASVISGNSKQELVNWVLQKRKQFLSQLSQKAGLMITFGTAWGYRHKELDIIVGNCHKAPGDTFDKELTSLHDLISTWKSLIQRLKHQFPELNIIFTVSPVRHIKDGLVENNRSKSRLIEFVHTLNSDGQTHYFPSYEIVIDELRDHRFFKEDLVHPTEQAVNYVWEAFKSACFKEETLQMMKKIRQVNRGLEHRSLHPESDAETSRMNRVLEQKAELTRVNPNIFWK